LIFFQVYDTLTPEEQARNMTGPDRLFIGKQHTLFELVHEVHIQGKNANEGSSERIKEQKTQSNGSANESNLREDADDNIEKNEEEKEPTEALQNSGLPNFVRPN
jgi:5'-3' exonuclease